MAERVSGEGLAEWTPWIPPGDPRRMDGATVIEDDLYVAKCPQVNTAISLHLVHFYKTDSPPEAPVEPGDP